MTDVRHEDDDEIDLDDPRLDDEHDEHDEDVVDETDGKDDADGPEDDDADEAGESAGAGGGADPLPLAAPSSRWARVGGALSLAYVVWYVGDLLLFATRPSTFSAAHRAYGSVAARLVLIVVLLGLLFHGTNGLRVAATDLRPTLARHDAGLRALARFVTFAVWIPTALAVLWPVIREGISR